MSSRRQMLEFLSLTRLPSAFQEVEYIESSGTQLISSAIIPNDYESVRIKIKFALADTNITWWSLFGSYSNSNNGILFQRTTFYNKTNGYGITENITEPIINEWHTFDLQMKSGDFFIFDNTTLLKSSSATYTGNITGLSNALTLFGTTNQQKSSTKVSYCEIYANDVLARIFVPCYRKSDNEIGMYDLVNGVFYTNAGTGTFIKGGNV